MKQLSRRAILHLCSVGLLSSVVPVRQALALTDFQRWQTEKGTDFERWQAQRDADIERYHRQYTAAFEQFKKSLEPDWGKTPDTKSRSAWIDYQSGVRRRLDFEKGQADVTVIQPPGETMEQTVARARAQMQAMFESRRQEFLQRDPVERQLAALSQPGLAPQPSSTPQASTPPVSQTPPSTTTHTALERPFEHLKPAADEISKAKGEQVQLPTGKPAVRVAVPVRKSLIKKRAPFLADIRKRSSQYRVHESLISAVIQAESYFNPMATSHIPAYGLMQIVPSSAGQDVTEYLYKRQIMLSADWLYNPENNILAGSTYLYLLSNRYLAGINNPLSLQHCTVAAYNTGPGNLARAFVGKRKVGAAISKINTMTPEQVYDHLRRYLPYEETQHYIVKVSKFQKSWAELSG